MLLLIYLFLNIYLLAYLFGCAWSWFPLVGSSLSHAGPFIVVHRLSNCARALEHTGSVVAPCRLAPQQEGS